MSKYRKAIAAFLAPLIALPLVGWVSGDVEFNESALAAGGIAALTGVVTYYFPNEEA